MLVSKFLLAADPDSGPLFLTDQHRAEIRLYENPHSSWKSGGER